MINRETIEAIHKVLEEAIENSYDDFWKKMSLERALEDFSEAFPEKEEACAKRYKIAKMECTCGGCPTQYDIWLENGDYVYFRLRHGYLLIEHDGEVVYKAYPEEDGVMSHDEVVRHLEKAGYYV